MREHLAARGIRVPPWRIGAVQAKYSHIVAREYLQWLQRRLIAELGWNSEQLVYAAWNTGLSRVLEANGSLERLNTETRRRAAQFSPEKHLVPW